VAGSSRRSTNEVFYHQKASLGFPSGARKMAWRNGFGVYPFDYLMRVFEKCSGSLSSFPDLISSDEAGNKDEAGNQTDTAW